MKRYLLGEGKTVVKSRTGESEWLRRNSYPKVGQCLGKGKERRELGHESDRTCTGQSGNVTCAGCGVPEPIMRASEVRESGSAGEAKEGRKAKAKGISREEVGGPRA